MRACTVVLLVILVAVGGCGDDQQTVRSSSSLQGRTFISQEVQGHGLVDGSEIRLTFEGDQLSANAGCNHLFGTVSTTGDVLAVGEMMGTAMGCDPARHDQDEWLVDFLTSGPRWDLDGNHLTLSGATAEIILLDRTEADPDRALEATRWVVDALSSGSGPEDSVSSVRLEADAHIVFTEGELEGSNGCNSISGSYRADDDGNIVITAIAQTAAACRDPAIADLESEVMAVLQSPMSYQITADQLTLRASSGRGLILHADE